MSDLYSPGQAASVVAALMVAGMLAGVAAGNAAVARVTDSYDELDLFARVFARLTISTRSHQRCWWRRPSSG